MSKKVFIGMSGGVDSSVSAALLVKAGYDVTGVFIKVWEPPQEKFGKICTSRDDRRDAMRVAAMLGIPFITVDLSAEYKKRVVDYMVEEYKKGRTPNPDVMCNTYVKFGAFFDWAIENGADYIATGHYARIQEGKLLQGVDPNKDQSYFLWNLTGKHCVHTLFPIGGYKKDEVRVLARKFKLPTAEKKDSQGLCFIGKLDIKEFLREFIEINLGEVHNNRGEVIGRHEGTMFYTIGERHGFQTLKQSPTEKPLYVVAKDILKNTLTVSENKIPVETDCKSTLLESVHWIKDIPLPGKPYQARIRHRGKLIPATILIRKGETGVNLTAAEILAPGQCLVLYDSDICLGGGIIK